MTQTAEGIWQIYIRRWGRRILDGEASTEEKARKLYAEAIELEPPPATIELVNPQGRIVDRQEIIG